MWKFYLIKALILTLIIIYLGVNESKYAIGILAWLLIVLAMFICSYLEEAIEKQNK